MSEPSSKQANPEDEDVSKEVKPDCQPALDRDGHVVSAILHVQTFFGIFDCSVLQIHKMNELKLRAETKLD